MKGQVMPAHVRMGKEALQELVTEVKETVATDLVLPEMPERTFGIVDLWNIRRNAISARSRFSR